jgi:hypothetical protein
MTANLHVFLLIGQSNMSGRGRLEEVALLQDPQVLMFRDGRWMAAEEPLHTDRPDIAGVGLGMSFAFELLASGFSGPIGLIPCAVGGTPLSRWMPGEGLYAHAVATTRLALSAQPAFPAGTLDGILWHQGESDSVNVENANRYGERFQEMITHLRADLSSANVPVIAGELGEFLEDNEGCKFYEAINRQLQELEGALAQAACVSAAGLTDNEDALHFNAQSLREFGRRYAAKFMLLKSA